jgi:DNA (cytosine-5)-methyltransferase 1
MKKLKALGIYIFQGGFTLGVRKHFEVVAHLEDGYFGVATVEKNLPNVDVFAVPDEWPVSSLRGVDFVYGNPPCAPWSNAGSRIGRPSWKDDPNTECWRHAARTAFKLNPSVIAIESVRPIYKLGREMLSDIAKEGRKHGYQTTVILENALDCNLPQKRPRFVLVLSKYQYMATPTYGKDVTPGEVLKAYAKEKKPEMNKRRAAAESLNARGSIENKVLKITPPGGRLSKHFAIRFPDAPVVNGRMIGRPSMLKFRIHPDKPSPTQPGGAVLFHHKEDRFLTIGEAAALCGYPADYEFVGSISNCYAQMGKAVLPNVGAHLAKDAARTIKLAHKLSKADIAQAQEITIFRDKIEIQNIIL